MANDGVVALSDQIKDVIRFYFISEDYSAAQAQLLYYADAVRRQAWLSHWPDAVERVQFDLLYLASRDVDRLKHLVELAIRDSRDIMAGEYFWVAGRSYPHEWARRHEVNKNSDKPPKLNEAIIATAELILRAKPREPAKTSEERIRRGLPQKLPSFNLNFSENSQLIDFGNRLKTLAMPDEILDLSVDLRYLGRHSPASTILRCLSDGEPEALNHDGKVLSWNGDADYWSECHFKCIELAKNLNGNQDMRMGGNANQRVRVSLNSLISQWR
jgi:hypothetical protein